MYDNVLVGVDFRQAGRDAIALAQTLKEPDGSMTLVHVYAGPFMPSHRIPAGLVEEERERGERQLEAEREQMGVQAELVLTQGPTPGQVLHEQAEQQAADLLVLGSCHRGALGRAMLGDDTRGALNGAPCAIAVAPAGYAEQPKPLERIGVGYDGSEESKVALQAARDLAASTGAQVVAFRLVSMPAYAYGAIGAAALANLDVAVEDAEKELRELKGVEGRAQYGLSTDLADLAAQVDLMVVGSRGYGPWGRLVHGSTSNRLASHTRGPLLIVPRASARSSDPATAEQAEAAIPA
jgi:nucleotide-binding universal stress UspA family protein